jgi:hypothetical protein
MPGTYRVLELPMEKSLKMGIEKNRIKAGRAIEVAKLKDLVVWRSSTECLSGSCETPCNGTQGRGDHRTLS